MNSFEIISGSSCKISTGLIVKHFKVKEILEFGEGNFDTSNSLFCYTPFDMIDVLFKSNIDYAILSNYDLFNILFPTYYNEKSIKLVINTFLGLEKDFEIVQVKDDSDKYYYLDKKLSKIIIDEESYLQIREFLFDIINFKNKKEEKFANNITKEMYIENLIEEKEFDNEKDKTERSPFLGLITTVVLELGYRYEEVLDLYIYQFYSLVNKIVKRQEYNNVMTGIYSGNVDSKKINMADYSWLID